MSINETETEAENESDSPTWRLHFKPYVNGKRVKWGEVTLNLVAGQRCELKLDYEDSTFIGDPDAFLALEYQEGVEGQGLVFDPPLGQYCEMAEGTTSLSWLIITDQAPSGPFGLKFKFPIGSTLPDSPLLPGEVINIAQEVDVVFEEFPLDFEENAVAYPCLGARHTFSVRPKPSSQLLDKPIKLIWGGDSLGVVVTPPLENDQLLTQGGVTWELDCLDTTNVGDFSLQLMLVGWEGVSPPLAMSLGHNLVRAERWSEEHDRWPDITWYSHHIRAISVFLNKPSPGVQVTVRRNDNTSYNNTNSQGEAQADVYDDTIIEMKIFNKYDGSIV
ncbi:hypothetical protein [Pseudomonas sp. S2_A02]|jgi:hypothetical protein